MFRSLHCCDFEVNNILLSDEAVLRRFLARRFEGDSNRFIMSFDQVIFPNITYSSGETSALFTTPRGMRSRTSAQAIEAGTTGFPSKII